MASGDLTTLASVKLWLGITTTSSDTLLTSLITAASTWITDYLSRNILSATYTEVRQGSGNESMVMRQYPITGVASVAWNGASYTVAADPLAGTTGFLFDGRRIDLIGSRFPYKKPVVITYTAGFPTVPADIAQACNELVGEAFKRKDRIGVSSQTITGGVSEVIAFSTKDMAATTATALKSYLNTVPV